MLPPGFGINLVASLSGNIGLGVTARNIARALERHRVPFVVVDTEHAWGGTNPVEGLEKYLAASHDEIRHPVTLYVLPIGVLQVLFQNNPWLRAANRLHVASLWWEASALPPSWIDNLSRFDAMLAGSGFIANVIANGLVLTPVIEAKHPLALPSGVRADRSGFGMAEDATVFTASFDPNSDPMRKNPVAMIRAFLLAFPPGVERVQLAIRMNNAATKFGEATLQAMTRAAAGDPRIAFLTGPMRYEEVLALYASGDAYVSLHRGEGLGLGLMEAMALGKPVIATAWSGNLSFMDATCGCLVRYRLVPVSGNWAFFRPEFIGPDARWAEPMVDDAALWMRRLHEDPALRLRLGEAAKARIDAYQAEAWGPRWIEEIVALWQARAFLPRVPGKYSA